MTMYLGSFAFAVMVIKVAQEQQAAFIPSSAYYDQHNYQALKWSLSTSLPVFNWIWKENNGI